MIARVLAPIAAFALIAVLAATALAEGLPPPPSWIGSPRLNPNATAAGAPRTSATTHAAGLAAAQAPAIPHKLPPTDSMILTNRSGTAQSQYPLQFGRPFLPGKVANFPQVVVNGTPVPTQADVKQRYPDGSVKHAILSVIIPSLPANGNLTLSFRNQSSGNNTPLSVQDMLAPHFDFDATLEASNPSFSPGITKHVSARDILTAAGSCADDVTNKPTALCAYWTKGSIATTVILADHSVNRGYDFGFTTENRAVRPIFHITFWPGLNRVKVRFIAETTNTQAIQDEFYSVNLSLGHGHPKLVYAKPDFAHHFGTRWTKLFWIGEPPEPKIDLDYNLADLAATKLVANYDISRGAGAELNAMWSEWQNKKKDIGDTGLWTFYMGTPGARIDIGNMPTWTVFWLYTGDWRAREITMVQADLAANWPLQAREGNSAMSLDRDHAVPGLGRTVTTYGRPTLWLFDERGRPNPTDAVAKVNPPGLMMVNTTTNKPVDYFGRSNQTWIKDAKFQWVDPRFAHYQDSYFDGWVADGAHQPDPYFGPYLLTGDYWYLEQMQMWAGAMSARYCVEAAWCRGPGAGIQDEVRGNAWALRNRVNAAVATPDGAPEKGVFVAMIDDALALWEGQRNIMGTQYQNNPLWNFGRNSAKKEKGPSPLHFWMNEPDKKEQLVTVDTPGTIAVGGGTSPWMQNYFIIALGRATELGFPARPLLSWLGSNLLGQLTDPDFNPYLTDAYRMPVTMANGTYLSSWGEAKLCFPIGSPDQPHSQKSKKLADDLTYISIARAATSFLDDQPNGKLAWTTLNTMIGARLPNINITWAIVPKLVPSAH